MALWVYIIIFFPSVYLLAFGNPVLRYLSLLAIPGHLVSFSVSMIMVSHGYVDKFSRKVKSYAVAEFIVWAITIWSLVNTFLALGRTTWWFLHFATFGTLRLYYTSKIDGIHVLQSSNEVKPNITATEQIELRSSPTIGSVSPQRNNRQTMLPSYEAAVLSSADPLDSPDNQV